MARVARVVIPGEIYHITQRGNYRQSIFRDDADRRLYLKWLDQNARKWGMLFFAYCLMDNHVHFIASPREENSFAKTLSIAHMKYAQYLHIQNGLSGHLWQGRFYSKYLEERHFQAALRYVERNPVRARMVRYAWDWKWSSAQDHLQIRENGYLVLKDISDYFDIDCWRDYLNVDDREDDLKDIR